MPDRFLVTLCWKEMIFTPCHYTERYNQCRLRLIKTILNSRATLVGGASVRFPSRLELSEESLMSEATLAESESRSSDDSALLGGREVELRLQLPAA